MKDYFVEYAENISHSLKGINSILKFTKNTAIVGQYTEKLVSEFLEKSISPLKLCTGGIIGPQLFNKAKTPQIDIIIYDPNPLPPIFHIDDFALVPQMSVFGALEIKRTDYNNGLDDLEKKLVELDKVTPDFNGEKPKSMGVICLVENNSLTGNNKLTKLLSSKNCIYLLEKKDDKLIINHENIFKLINYIVECKSLHKRYYTKITTNTDNIFDS